MLPVAIFNALWVKIVFLKNWNFGDSFYNFLYVTYIFRHEAFTIVYPE